MAQKLTLPLNNMMLQAGYKSAMYEKEWGWKHYGIDATDPDSKNIVGMGNGTVIAAGQDGEALTGPNSRLGNVVVIRYNGVELADGTIKDLICRMYHLDKIAVKIGESVTAKTIIGQYGNTGANTTGSHLHIEFDKDVNWPTLAPGVSIGKGKIINTASAYANAGGIADTTIAPANVLNIGTNQSIGTKWLGTWVNQSDLDIPAIAEETNEELERLRNAITEYEVERNKVMDLLEEMEKLMAETRTLLK